MAPPGEIKYIQGVVIYRRLLFVNARVQQHNSTEMIYSGAGEYLIAQ